MIKILKLDHRIIPLAIIDISINSIINDILDVSCFKGQNEKEKVVAKLIQRERGRECETPRGNASGG